MPPYGLTPDLTLARARSHKPRGTMALVPIGSYRAALDLPPDTTILPDTVRRPSEN